MKTNTEPPLARIVADWRMPRDSGSDCKCRRCKHCGTAREIGVVCKHPRNDFCGTELDAVCNRFESRA
jgi:hypothetical protein